MPVETSGRSNVGNCSTSAVTDPALTRSCSLLTRALALLTMLCIFASSAGVRAGEYPSAGDVAIVSGVTVAATGLGSYIGDFDSTRTSLIGGPLLLERSLQRLLGGKFDSDRSNFLRGSLGSAATPVACGVMLAAADAAWPPEKRGRFIAQDLFLYTAGLITTKGITGSFKGVFARPRPYRYYGSGAGESIATQSYAFDHSSFFSGHVSAAFFATTFLNKRLRSTMRRELTCDEYGDWRWISPAVLYSWAAFVGWTRIHAYDHYITDVLAGAVAGYLLAELFYSLGYDAAGRPVGCGSGECILRLNFSF